MIEFKTVRYKNFLSAGNNFTEINLERPGITLVIGANGAGKTTLLDALSFALFGRAFRNINKPQIVNSINNKDCLVELDIVINDIPYVIRRGIKPNVFEVFKDSKSLMEELVHIHDQQAWFEANVLNGMNFKTFSQIVVLSATNYTSFLNLPSAARRQFVEDVLQLRPFSTMNFLAKKKAATISEKIRENKYQQDLTSNSLEDLKRIADQTRESVDNIIALKRQQIADVEASIKELEGALETYREEIAAVDFSKPTLDKLLAQQREFDAVVSKADFKIKQITTKGTFFEENDVCPTCEQPISDDIKKHQLEHIDNEKASTTTVASEAQLAIDRLQLKINTLRIAERKLETLRRNRDDTSTAIADAKQRIKDIERDTINIVRKQTNISDKELSKLQNQMTKLQEAKESLDEQARTIDIALQLLRDDGIKAQIIKHYVPIINHYIEEYLTMLDYYVGFEFDENFDETIKARHRDEFTYGSFSQGEKSRIDLALLFAWREVASLRNSIKTNLLIMDEVLDSSMDSMGIELLFDVLTQVESSIIIISHREVFVDKVPSVIKFEKHGNFSRIVEEEK